MGWIANQEIGLDYIKRVIKGCGVILNTCISKQAKSGSKYKCKKQ